MNSHPRAISILGTGIALPEQIVLSEDIDKKMDLVAGTTERITGIVSRYHATHETASELSVLAIKDALDSSKLSLDDIDCIICASATMEQAIPYNAAKIHALLKPRKPIPAFDINMTCLSGLMALDTAASMITACQYEKILIVSCDIASLGLDWKTIETTGLFGDGAAAMIVSSSQEGQSILGSQFETFSQGVEYCQIRGGGTLNPPSKVKGDYQSYCYFEMDGKKVYSLSAKVIVPFLKKLLTDINLTLDDIDWIVPHQASAQALYHMQRKLGIKSERLINILSSQGNQVSASLPSALHHLLTQHSIKKGDKVLLIGTSAGLSLGAMILEL